LVTGADGQLGRDVIAAAAGVDDCLAIGCGRQELDVTDDKSVERVFHNFRPDAVIHCAAWTAVDDAEQHPDLADRLNGGGTRRIAEAAQQCGAHLVMVSTDYVFDGADPSGYAEEAALGPINAYGRSKAAAESAAARACPDAAIVRTSWLFGEHGPNFVQTILHLASTRDSIDVVDDQRGCPTWTNHLAGALIEVARNRTSGILHLVDAPACSWHELARAVVDVAGLNCDVLPCASDRFPRPAARPACSILRSTRPDAPEMGSWRAGITAVVEAAGRRIPSSTGG
jgi:dTDP-4-dehydrorhamnose reductase